MKAHFARYGIPDRATSDNGRPFNSKEFASFVSLYGFEHVTSSLGYPQSNGKAQNAVKAGKNSHEKQKTKQTKNNNNRKQNRPISCFAGTQEHPKSEDENIIMPEIIWQTNQNKNSYTKILLKPETCSDVRSKLMEKKKIRDDRGVAELEALRP